MCIRDRCRGRAWERAGGRRRALGGGLPVPGGAGGGGGDAAVSYTHLRAHETVLELVCRLLLETQKQRVSDTRR